jgi:hypothetical protein
MWSEAAKESYLKNKSRFYAIDPKLVKGLLDFHNLCKMSEFDFEVELNRRFQEQKEWDDYNAAFTIAQEQLRALELSRRETRSVTRAKEQVATGKTAVRVSTPKPDLRKRSSTSTPVSSPGKGKARGHTVGSPQEVVQLAPLERQRQEVVSCHLLHPHLMKKMSLIHQFLLLPKRRSARHRIP